MSSENADPVMKCVRKLFEASGLSLEELGQKMGYPAASARKSAWQFLRRTADPRVSMLRRFAVALGAPLNDLFTDR
jgi:transcriptional regulator with XRE-family HTH domain